LTPRGERIRLLTRNGNDWSEPLPAVAAAVILLTVKSSVTAHDFGCDFDVMPASALDDAVVLGPEDRALRSNISQLVAPRACDPARSVFLRNVARDRLPFSVVASIRPLEKPGQTDTLSSLRHRRRCHRVAEKAR